MTQYLLDTNVVLRFANTLDPQHSLVVRAIRNLLAQDNECFITAQVLIEFWVVTTRPTSVNGFGWNVEQAIVSVAQLRTLFPLLEDRPEIFPIWLELVTTNKIKGKRSHDIRLIAIMLSHNVDHLLTFNPSDFAIASTLTIVHPETLQ